jgi:hypothetical protein
MADSGENAENAQAANNARRRPTIAPMASSETAAPMKTRPPMTPLPPLAPRPAPVVEAPVSGKKPKRRGKSVALLVLVVLAGAGAWMFLRP